VISRCLDMMKKREIILGNIIGFALGIAVAAFLFFTKNYNG
jgi:predicted small secreted protein